MPLNNGPGTAPFIPDVATMRLQLDQNSKVVAFSLLGEILICERACYRTQIKDIAVCLEETAEDSLMFTNQMRIQSTLDDQVQSELSSNSLQHLLRHQGWQKCSLPPQGQDMQHFHGEKRGL